MLGCQRILPCHLLTLFAIYQADSDYNGVGDACDSHVDRDGDGRLDNMDNCPKTSNAEQADADGDGWGDVCDSDMDNDGLLNEVDSCPLVSNPTNGTWYPISSKLTDNGCT